MPACGLRKETVFLLFLLWRCHFHAENDENSRYGAQEPPGNNHCLLSPARSVFVLQLFHQGPQQCVNELIQNRDNDLNASKTPQEFSEHLTWKTVYSLWKINFYRWKKWTHCDVRSTFDNEAMCETVKADGATLLIQVDLFFRQEVGDSTAGTKSRKQETHTDHQTVWRRRILFH